MELDKNLKQTITDQAAADVQHAYFELVRKAEELTKNLTGDIKHQLVTDLKAGTLQALISAREDAIIRQLVKDAAAKKPRKVRSDKVVDDE